MSIVKYLVVSMGKRNLSLVSMHPANKGLSEAESSANHHAATTGKETLIVEVVKVVKSSETQA